MIKQIYYYDTDAGGVVYYANYLKFMEEARTEFLEQRGLSIDEMKKIGLLFAVRKCSINYKSPARYGDIILCDASLKKMTAAQLIFDQNIYEKESRLLLVEGEVILVCLSKDFKPIQIPNEVKKLLAS